MTRLSIAKTKYESGQAALIAVMFFIAISLALIGGFSLLGVTELQSAKLLEKSKRGYFFAEGAMEDAVYRLRAGKNMPSTVTYSETGLSATTTVADVLGAKEINARGSNIDAVRKLKVTLTQTGGVSFSYGVQVGDGGLIMENSSSVQGNVYSNGPISGQNSNLTKGDIVSAGSSGVIDGVHATGTAYAHIIRNSTIDKDAYYQTISNTSVGGTLYPGSADQPKKAFPITDTMIDDWEQSATSTIISSPCPYKITNNITIGPAKITCNVEISGNPTVTIAGTVWISGNLEIENNAIIRLDPALGKKSIAIIVDNLSNRSTSSKISLENTTTFQNSGTAGSYILFVSQNNSAEGGGTEKAVDVKNSLNGDVLVFAGHGEIQLQNSAQLREVTGYRIRIKNSAQVIYETGLADLLFQGGPSGGFGIESWKEVP